MEFILDMIVGTLGWMLKEEYDRFIKRFSKKDWDEHKDEITDQVWAERHLEDKDLDDY